MTTYQIQDLIKSQALTAVKTENNKIVYKPTGIKVSIKQNGLFIDVDTLCVQSGICLVKWVHGNDVIEYTGEPMSVSFDGSTGYFPLIAV